MMQIATAATPTAAARTLCQTTDLDAALAAIERGDTAAAKQQLQDAIAHRQHLAEQMEAIALTGEAFATVFDRAAAGIAQLDATGRFVKINDRCSELLGYDAEEFTRLTLAELLFAEDCPDLEPALQQLLRGEIQAITYEKRGRHRQGYEVWLHLSLSTMWCPIASADCILLVLQALDSCQIHFVDDLRERQYQAIADALPNAIFQTNLSGTWTFLSPAWTELSGFSLDESLGSSFINFLEPVKVDGAACWAVFQDLLAGGREFVCCEVRSRSQRSNLRSRRLEFSAKRFYDSDGTAIGAIGTLTDITHRCQTEPQLQAAIETVPGLVSWVSPEGNYLGVNDRLANTLHRHPAEIVGENIGFLGENQTFRDFLQAFLASPATHTSQILEAEVDGKFYCYSIAGQKHHCDGDAVLVGIDITQNQRAERALRESEAKFRQLAENIEQVFWMLDLACKKMIYVSPAYEQTWGRPLATVYRPQAWMDTVHPDDYTRVLRAMPRQIRGEYDIEYRILRPNGDVRWIRDRAFPVRDEAGQVYRLAGIAEDITERKQAKAGLETRERYLSALVDMQRHLLAATVDTDLYDEILPILGRVSEATTIYVYENAPDGQSGARLQAQWHSRWPSGSQPTDTTDPAARAAALPKRLEKYAQFSASWSQALQRGEFVSGAIADLDPIESGFFQARGTRWALALPLLVAGKFYGFIGFESLRERNPWGALVKNLLGSAAATLALARERQLNQEVLCQQLTAIEASTDGIFIINPKGQLRYVNPSYHRILGYNAASSLMGCDWQLPYPEETVAAIVTSLQVGGRWSGEVVAQRLGGSTLVAELSMTVTRDREIVGVCRDISERKQAEENLKASLEEKELLLKEVHHRVKNNLQVISSLFHLSTHVIDDPIALSVLEESQNRISSMALIHRKLYQSESLSKINFAEYLRDLIYHLLASYNADPDRIQTELHLESISLNLDAAIPCGLLLNELISNALKHAFPHPRPGRLRIRFVHAPDGNLYLQVADNGIGLPEGFDPDRCTSLGISLIVSLTQQLGGSLKMYNDPGAAFEIAFPQPIERRRF